jgi:hypothetical protein
VIPVGFCNLAPLRIRSFLVRFVVPVIRIELDIVSKCLRGSGSVSYHVRKLPNLMPGNSLTPAATHAEDLLFMYGLCFQVM